MPSREDRDRRRRAHLLGAGRLVRRPARVQEPVRRRDGLARGEHLTREPLSGAIDLALQRVGPVPALRDDRGLESFGPAERQLDQVGAAEPASVLDRPLEDRVAVERRQHVPGDLGEGFGLLPLPLRRSVEAGVLERDRRVVGECLREGDLGGGDLVRGARAQGQDPGDARARPHRHREEPPKAQPAVRLAVERVQPGIVLDLVGDQRLAGHGDAAREALADLEARAQHGGVAPSARDDELVPLDEPEAAGLEAEQAAGGVGDRVEQGLGGRQRCDALHRLQERRELRLLLDDRLPLRVLRHEMPPADYSPGVGRPPGTALARLARPPIRGPDPTPVP